MLRREVGVSDADLSLLAGNISKLGGYALDLVDRLDLPLDRDAFAGHLARTKEQLRSTAAGDGSGALRLRPPKYADLAVLDDLDLTWDFPQTLRFAAGACMISQMYYRWMSEENVRHSLLAKVLYKCQTGILDDLIDKGGYGYLEAKELYHLILSSMTDPVLDVNTFRKRLMTVLHQEHLELYDLMVAMATNFNDLFSLSPEGSSLFYEMEVLDERVALGQALTTFQKEPHLDLGQVANIARSFYTPSEDIAWHERLANYISGGTRYNLIDLSFSDRRLQDEKLRELLTGWYYFDLVIVFLNNVVGIQRDLREGIVNLSLVAMREKEVLPLLHVEGYQPGLTLADYRGHLLRLADLASEGLDHASAALPDPRQYYPFITVMMPVVMMAEWIGKNDEMIHTYVEGLAPALQRAVDRSRAQESVEIAPVP